MGYFPNGSAGDWYEATYCRRCVHDDAENGCPVMLAHVLHNYEECNRPESILHILIPRDDRGFNQQCGMFHERNGKGHADEQEG